ncbi:uncharacterized protein DDB_G0287625-like [Telopea speciosissima]|uniref:uncharacterized protein DDB_G0287625-like n=1 Tax=Telopea speciosissima TaxID=54955 RepID=UPI001CC374E9|nr:uncharacterized protein DDB_G0287625-like [Telopea speciosissima]
MAKIVQSQMKAIEGKIQDNKRSAPDDCKDNKRSRTELRQEKGDRPPGRGDHRSERSERASSLEFTPLNTTRSQILMQMQDRVLLKWPRPMLVGPENRSTNRYYLFHKDYGHDTEECYQLKREIENLVKVGSLDKYVKGRHNGRSGQGDRDRGQDWEREEPRREERRADRDRERDRTDERRDAPEPSGTKGAPILTILGGSGQESTRKAKAHARFMGVVEKPSKIANTETVISFSDADLEGASFKHEDALVVQVEIANRPVHRVLIDTGASVDVLSLEAYRQFGFGDDQLKPEATYLHGFSGATAPIRGTIELLVTFGEYLDR